MAVVRSASQCSIVELQSLSAGIYKDGDTQYLVAVLSLKDLALIVVMLVAFPLALWGCVRSFRAKWRARGEPSGSRPQAAQETLAQNRSTRATQAGSPEQRPQEAPDADRDAEVKKHVLDIVSSFAVAELQTALGDMGVSKSGVKLDLARRFLSTKGIATCNQMIYIQGLCRANGTPMKLRWLSSKPAASHAIDQLLGNNRYMRSG